MCILCLLSTATLINSSSNIKLWYKTALLLSKTRYRSGNILYVKKKERRDTPQDCNNILQPPDGVPLSCKVLSLFEKNTGCKPSGNY